MAVFVRIAPPADGAAAVTIAISKKKGANGVAVANAVLEKLSSLKGYIIPESGVQNV